MITSQAQTYKLISGRPQTASYRSGVSATSKTLVKVATACKRSAGVCQAATQEPNVADASSKAKTTKPVCIVTGSSSGVGAAAAKALSDQGWYVVMANRDYSKSVQTAKSLGIPKENYKIIPLDLESLDGVRYFVSSFLDSGLHLDAIVANAAVYKPLLKEPEFTADGFELCVGTNHLGHFLLLNLLLDKLSEGGPNKDPRCVILGTVTHNPNELGGKIPPQANLGDLKGMASGMTNMIDGKEFSAPKAYKDSKVANVMTMKEMHKRFHKSKGITFTSLYPGCVATTPLFRNHLPLFQYLFPLFQKNITGAFVTEELAGERVAELVTGEKYSVSGTYWSWGGRQQAGRSSFVQEVSNDAGDSYKAERLFDLSKKLVGLDEE